MSLSNWSKNPSGPVIDVPFAVQVRALHLSNSVPLGVVPWPKEMQGDIARREGASPDGAPDTVQHMVAVRFQHHLYPRRCDLSQKLAILA